MAKIDKKDLISSPPGAAIVAVEFHDKDDFSKVWVVGNDVSSFDEARLADLSSKGLITIGAIQTEPAP